MNQKGIQHLAGRSININREDILIAFADAIMVFFSKDDGVGIIVSGIAKRGSAAAGGYISDAIVFGAFIIVVVSVEYSSHVVFRKERGEEESEPKRVAMRSGTKDGVVENDDRR